MQISTEQLIKYFAAFPKKEGVLQLFDKNVLPEPMRTTYANLKQYITDLPEESIIPHRSLGIWRKRRCGGSDREQNQRFFS